MTLVSRFVKAFHQETFWLSGGMTITLPNLPFLREFLRERVTFR